MAIIGLLTDGIIKSGSATGDILNRSRAISKSLSTILHASKGHREEGPSASHHYFTYTPKIFTQDTPLEKTKNKRSMYGMNENQNVFMDGKRTTSRVTNEPGGKSSVQLGWDSPKSERNLLCLSSFLILLFYSFSPILFHTLTPYSLPSTQTSCCEGAKVETNPERKGERNADCRISYCIHETKCNNLQ